MKWTVIADEITAVGWRLAGARVEMPDAQLVGECLESTQHAADLVLITAELAARVPVGQLEQALLSQPPLLLVIADLRHNAEPADLADEVRRALGVAT